MNARIILIIAVLALPAPLLAEVTADLPPGKLLQLDPAIKKDLVKTGEQIQKEMTSAQSDHTGIGDLWKKLEAADAAGDERQQQEIVMALAARLKTLKARLKHLDELYVKRSALAQQLLREAAPREDLPPMPPSQEFTDAAREWAEKALPQLSPAKRKSIRGRIEADKMFNDWAKLERQYSALPGISSLSTIKDLIDVVHGAHAAREAVAKYAAVADIQLNVLDGYATAKVEGDPRSLGAFGLGEAAKPAEKLFKRQNRREQEDSVGNPF